MTRQEWQGFTLMALCAIVALLLAIVTPQWTGHTIQHMVFLP